MVNELWSGYFQMNAVIFFVLAQLLSAEIPIIHQAVSQDPPVLLVSDAAVVVDSNGCSRKKMISVVFMFNLRMYFLQIQYSYGRSNIIPSIF